MADHPLTLYAATKKANEAMSHSYAHLWQIPTTCFPLLHGLRAVGTTGHGADQIP